MSESYRIAGIDVHKSMLAVAVTDAAAEGEFVFERRKFGTLDSDLKALAEWLAEREVREAVMESTAQYWKPVWRQLEEQMRLYLAQAQSNRAPRGRKRDFADAERLTRRHIAGELIVSFVPDPEQRLWRTIARTKNQLTRDRVRLNNQLESFLEDGRVKLAACVSDLLGVSSLRILRAIARGETDAATLAEMAEQNLKTPPERLADALRAAATWNPVQRQVLQGREESAEVSKSNRSPKGNRAMRRVLNQAANAAVKTQGSVFQLLYRRWVPRLGHNKTIWAVAHRLCRLVWIILHRGEDYVEYGEKRNQQAQKRRSGRLVRELRALGYQIIPPATQEQLA
jgi:transposase